MQTSTTTVMKKPSIIFLTFGAFLVLGNEAAVTSCTHNGNVYDVGDSWVADDGCNGCDCTEWGKDCRSHVHCTPNNILGNPGDPICKYSYLYYKVGDSWTADDECNTCDCTVDGMICTYDACRGSGFDPPIESGGGEFMDCPYKDRYYRYMAHFLADNGCNTCICSWPGNYATFPVCTTTKCSLLDRK